MNTDFGLDWSDYGARYYDAAIARWNSVDPMAESYYSTSSYAYVLNNPINLIDPNGMFAADPGDFYGSNGKYLGSDGNDDGKVHIISSKKETKGVKKSLRQAKKKGVDESFVFENSNLNSTITIDKGTVNGVVASTEAMGKETSKGAGDGGLHEEGGHSKDGVATSWTPGAKKDGKNGKASITLFNGVSNALLDLENIDAIWHVHTNKKTNTGEVVDGKPQYKVGGSGPSSTGPNSDLNGHKRLQSIGFKGVSIVSGGNENTVHFYNSKGSYHSVSFKRFKKMGKR